MGQLRKMLTYRLILLPKKIRNSQEGKDLSLSHNSSRPAYSIVAIDSYALLTRSNPCYILSIGEFRITRKTMTPRITSGRIDLVISVFGRSRLSKILADFTQMNKTDAIRPGQVIPSKHSKSCSQKARHS